MVKHFQKYFFEISIVSYSDQYGCATGNVDLYIDALSMKTAILNILTVK